MRKVITFLTASITGGAICIVLFFVIGIASVILSRGHSAIDIEFLTTATSEAGASGGILWQIIGTIILIISAALIAVPLATAIALLHSFILIKDSFIQRSIGLLLQIFNAIPSIIFGIIGLLVFTKYLDWGKSWLAGGIVLGIMIIPTITITVTHRIATISPGLLESAIGLGLRRGQIIRSVILPQSASALISGLLMGLARAAGETAPILFVATIFAGSTIPTGIKDNPVLSLSYHIFILAQDSFHESAQTNVWGTALVLVAIITLFGLIAIPLRNRIKNAADHA